MQKQLATEGVLSTLAPAKTECDLDVIAGLFDAKAPARHVLPGGVIFLDGEKADTAYQVVSGTVRCCTISEDGRRQIFRFVRPGDFLGLADLDTWHYTSEAVDHVMGHVNETMRSNYRHRLPDDRLLKVTNHVRSKIFNKRRNNG